MASAPTGTSNSISGTIATIPTYTNASTLDFSLINKSSFLATTDALVAGNTIYYSALPKLDSPVVGVASNIGTNGFMANWSVVLNATGGYIVKVYNGTTLVNNTPVSGQTSTSVAITGLSTGTTYTYTVTAVGDAINYDLSNESSASQSFSTLGLAIPVVGTASAISSNSFTANWTPVANASGYNVLTYLTSNYFDNLPLYVYNKQIKICSLEEYEQLHDYYKFNRTIQMIKDLFTMQHRNSIGVNMFDISMLPLFWSLDDFLVFIYNQSYYISNVIELYRSTQI